MAASWRRTLAAELMELVSLCLQCPMSIYHGTFHVVSELLDTGFLGEGLISSMIHANKNIVQKVSSELKRDFRRIHIPAAGRVFLQAVAGDCIHEMQGFNTEMISALGISLSSSYSRCHGRACASDVHISRWLRTRRIVAVSNPVQLFSFDFAALTDSDSTSASRIRVPLVSSRVRDMLLANEANKIAFVLYWDCECLPPGLCAGPRTLPLLSTDPQFLSPSPDHWRQSLYFLNQEACVALRQMASDDGSTDLAVNVSAWHDSDNIQLQIATDSSAHGLPDAVAPNCSRVCSCGYHVGCSCFRFAELNAYMQSPGFHRSLRTIDQLMTADVNGKVIIVTLGDNMLVPAAVVSYLNRNYSGRHDADIRFLAAFTSVDCMRCAKETVDETSLQYSNPCVSATALSYVNIFSDSSSDSGHHSSNDCCEDEDSNDTPTIISEIKRLLCPEAAIDSSNSNESGKKRKLDAAADGPCSGSKVLLLGEPYFHSLQDEWRLEHLLQYWNITETVRSHLPPIPCGTNRRSVGNAIGDVCIYAAAFECDALHRSTVCPVGIVERIDMSAINTLIEDTSSSGVRIGVTGRGTDVVTSTLLMPIASSFRLDQWGARIHSSSVTCVGKLSQNDISGTPDPSLHMISVQVGEGVEQFSWGSGAQLQLYGVQSATDLEPERLACPRCGAGNANTIHGFCFWTGAEDVCNGYQTTHAVSMLSKGYCLQCPESIREIDIIVGLTTQDHRFVVGLLP
jgi:hypothetical protein